MSDLPFTREMVLAEPAGERMDAWVYEHAWFRTRNPNGSAKFSTDICSAWDLLEELLSSWGGEFSTYENGWLCRFDEPGEGEEVVADTAQLAICRAALLDRIKWSYIEDQLDDD